MKSDDFYRAFCKQAISNASVKEFLLLDEKCRGPVGDSVNALYRVLFMHLYSFEKLKRKMNVRNSFEKINCCRNCTENNRPKYTVCFIQSRFTCK